MNDIVIVGAVSLFGIVAVLVTILIKQIVSRASERHMREEKGLIEKINTLRTAFDVFRLELEKPGMIHFNIVVTERIKQDVTMLNFSHNLKGPRLDRFNKKREEYNIKIEAYEKHARESIARAFFPDFPTSLEESERQFKKALHDLIQEIFEIAKNR